jgi:tRNA modification GTPase
MVQQALIDQGCQSIAWQDWIHPESAEPLDPEPRTPDPKPQSAWRRANPLRAAALLALAEARTERTAAILLDQYHGALGRAVNEVRKCLDRNDLDGARARLEDLVARSAIGLHLIQPWRVVVAGPPNAGKSTLVNAMVGYARAIVDPQPGTTRDLVTALTAIEGWPVELCDTAGLRDAAHPVEQAGVAAARRSLAEADLVLLVFDLTQPWSAADQELLSTQPDAVIVHNKADLAPAASHALSAGLPPPPGRRVSALHKAGLEDLLHAIAARLVPHPPEPGAAIPFMREQVTILVRAAHAVAQGDPEGAQHVLKSLTHHR